MHQITCLFPYSIPAFSSISQSSCRSMFSGLFLKQSEIKRLKLPNYKTKQFKVSVANPKKNLTET